jgi:hypothetical protein
MNEGGTGSGSVNAEVVLEFLGTLTETEAGPGDWPEYQRLLDALDEAAE